MKLPSYLAISRHGVYYFRLVFIVNAQRREKRWSLHTKSSTEAKYMALKIRAVLNENPLAHKMLYSENAPDRLGVYSNSSIGNDCIMADKRFAAQLITTLELSGGRKIEMQIDQSDPKDVKAGREVMLAALKHDAEVMKQNGLLENLNFINHKATQLTTDIDQHIVAEPAVVSINEVCERYQSRFKGARGPKTLDEYGRMQRSFAVWIDQVKKCSDYPIRLVSRPDVANFIDELQSRGIKLQTIQKKYLSALNALFELAQSTGAYPMGDLPSRNHKILTGRDKKKNQMYSHWKSFSAEDLLKIFDPQNFLEFDKPCDYWLPLLGLYTGARINEICQLTPKNIREVGGVWVLDINNEEGRSIKTNAGIRKVPIHPVLIELGFLDYVADVTSYDKTIFPYMTPDKYGHYTKTPGRRFGEYLERLGISDEKKVFHSFRGTANDKLKQSGVDEERRCQFIGHEHETVNSKNYSNKLSEEAIYEFVLCHLNFGAVVPAKLKYTRENMRRAVDNLMTKAMRSQAHKELRQARQIDKET